MSRLFVFMISALFLLTACNRTGSDPALPDVGHIEYYGFVLIDTYWDDPTDSSPKSNYADEVSSFTNIADILVAGPTVDIRPSLEIMAEEELAVILHMNELFFEVEGDSAPSGTDYRLRDNYEERWDVFKATSSLSEKSAQIAAFYIGEEPTWNGITYTELKAVSDLLESDFPEISTMVIEAYPALEQLQIPASTDWIGFDHYFVKNPATDTNYQQEWELLKSKRSDPGQKLVVIMDTHYIEHIHGDLAGIELNEMGEVARNYISLAASDPSVIAILGYFWPNGFDAAGAIGARGMPADIRDEYIRIGEEIIQNNGSEYLTCYFVHRP